MSDRIHIPQVFHSDGISPGWISVVNQDKTPAKPYIRCQCGVYCGIGLHSVSANGEVNNSFYHTKESKNAPGCGWHVFLFLDGYAETVGVDFAPEK